MVQKKGLPRPEPAAETGPEALVDGTAHNALRRRPQRMSPALRQLHRQAVLSLADHRAGGGPPFHPGAPVGGQPVLPALMAHRADAAGEPSRRKRHGGHRQHQPAVRRPAPGALSPEVGAGEGPAPVGLHVAGAAGEIQTLAVEHQRSLQRVPHAEHPMGALHPRQEPERTHDVRPKGREGTAPQDAVEGESLPLDMEPGAGVVEDVLAHPDLKLFLRGLKLRARIFQPPAPPVRENLEGRAPPPLSVNVEGGDQGQGRAFSGLIFQVPPFKIRSPPPGAVIVFLHSLTPLSMSRTASSHASCFRYSKGTGCTREKRGGFPRNWNQPTAAVFAEGGSGKPQKEKTP